MHHRGTGVVIVWVRNIWGAQHTCIGSLSNGRHDCRDIGRDNSVYVLSSDGDERNYLNCDGCGKSEIVCDWVESTKVLQRYAP